MKSSRGFTVIELLIVIVLLAGASILFFVQKSHVESAARDDSRKTSINAVYYALEEVYYKENQSYPRTIDSDTLPYIDPALLSDPDGVEIGEGTSDLRYEPLDCDGDACQSYTLRTTLENEDDYIKESNNA